MNPWHPQLLMVQDPQASRTQVRDAVWHVVDHLEEEQEGGLLNEVADLLLTEKIPHAASVVGVLYSADLPLPSKTHPWLLAQLEGSDVLLAMASAQMLALSGGRVLLAEYLSTKASPHQEVLESLWKTFLQHE